MKDNDNSVYQRTRSLGFMLTILGLVACGCSERLPDGLDAVYPVEVTVTYNGDRLTDAEVYFVPADGNPRFAAVGKTDAAGKATLYTLNKYKGAKAGPHNISIVKWESFETGKFEENEAGEAMPVMERKSLVPAKFADHITSGLSENVEPGKNSINLDLTNQ